MFRRVLRQAGLAVLMAAVLIITVSGTVFAHRMLIETPEEGVILVRYDDGTAAGRADVTLYDEDGQTLEEGKVNEEGLFHFGPDIQPHRIVADDGMGHRARWVEGEVDTWHVFPRWQRGMLGVSIFLFIAAFAYYKKREKTAA